MVCALVLSLAYPTKEFLAQRGEIGRLQQQQRDAQARVVALEERKRQLSDPAYVRALARKRLHFVLPGETAYIVLPPEPADEPDPAEDLPWYSQLWRSVGEADRPVAAPAQ